MPPVFDDKARTDLDPIRRDESLYSYYDRSARPGYETLRVLIDCWASELPTDVRHDLVSRLRANDEQGFEAALVELVTHALLLRLGHRVESHPPVPRSSNRPDYVAFDRDDIAGFYVEVTTINPSRGEVARDNREAVIYETLNRARLPPDLRLGWSISRFGQASPASSRLRAEVEQWAAEIADEARRESIARRFELDDWQIDLTLHGGFAPRARRRAIAASSTVAQWVEPASDLRAALETKANRYGELDGPYVIVVADRTERLTLAIGGVEGAVTEVALGDEVIPERLTAAGQVDTRLERRGGFWFRGGKAVHQGVSAILVFPDASLWRLREPRWRPLLAHNPWALKPVDEHLLPLTRLAVRDDRWQLVEGREVADILEMPDPWPPHE